MEYDALLFDLDGVLIDSEPLHWQAWQMVLSRFGIELDWETYRTQAIGVEDREMLELVARRAGQPVEVEALWGQCQEKSRIFLELLAKARPVPEGLPHLLATFQQRHIPMAVVSSSRRLEVLGALEACNLRSFFTEVVAWEDVRHPKPDPEPYQLAAQRLGARKPLVFEDSQVGVRSARAARFDVIQVEHPRQLPDLLRALL